MCGEVVIAELADGVSCPRLRAALREYFPAALEAYTGFEPTSRAVLALLAKAPTPAAAGELTLRQPPCYLSEAGWRGECVDSDRRVSGCCGGAGVGERGVGPLNRPRSGVRGCSPVSVSSGSLRGMLAIGQISQGWPDGRGRLHRRRRGRASDQASRWARPEPRTPRHGLDRGPADERAGAAVDGRRRTGGQSAIPPRVGPRWQFRQLPSIAAVHRVDCPTAPPAPGPPAPGCSPITTAPGNPGDAAMITAPDSEAASATALSDTVPRPHDGPGGHHGKCERTNYREQPTLQVDPVHRPGCAAERLWDHTSMDTGRTASASEPPDTRPRCRGTRPPSPSAGSSLSTA